MFWSSLTLTRGALGGWWGGALMRECAGRGGGGCGGGGVGCGGEGADERYEGAFLMKGQVLQLHHRYDEGWVGVN